MSLKAPRIIDLQSIEPVQCPCGVARRALSGDESFPGTVHLTDIRTDAAAHHHREHTELYVVLSCQPDAAIELDGVQHPVRPMTAILIPPEIVHRAVGVMRVLIVCIPDFDDSDEHLQDLTRYNTDNRRD